MKNDIFTRIKNGETVAFSDPDYPLIPQACTETMRLIKEMNQTNDVEKIQRIMKQITEDKTDDTLRIFTPFHINYGKNTKIGKNVFINFNCVFLDLGGIEIEENVMLAPGVKLLSEGHPIEPSERQKLIAKKIHIKKNVWIGADAKILQGVTIGENSVVAAGSVVTQDIPANVVVGGIPAKIIKHL